MLSRWNPVSMLVMMTFAPLSVAPSSLVIVPVSAAVVLWAESSPAEAPMSRAIMSSQSQCLFLSCMQIPPRYGFLKGFCEPIQ